MDLQQKGRKGEARAESYLIKQGFKLLFRRFRTRNAEIDLIAAKKETLYFIEVKWRGSPRRGDPFEAITPIKIKRMHQAAEYFLLCFPEYFRFKKFQLAAIAIRHYPHPLPIEWRVISN